MSERFDIVVVGAGLVGLAVARALALRGAYVLVLDRHGAPIQETSSRNSGVLHSGIYYKPGSLKARLCVRGLELLYAYCAQRDIAHSRCGKIILAQSEQKDELESLSERARLNGVGNLQLLTRAEVCSLEPEVVAHSGLLSPSTGIVDVHELAYALIGDVESAGGVISYNSNVEEAELTSSGISVSVRTGEDRVRVDCNLMVNSAGLDAVRLLALIRGYPSALLRPAYFAKGNYFSLAGVRPFRHLVYPMPNQAGLGIHATLDLDRSVRFGPNVEWVERPEYSVDPNGAAEFYDSIRRYWPALPGGSLQPAYAGVRPKLVGPGSAAGDFVIEGDALHGCKGLINLLGIESPGLTSSLAIGELVAAMA